MYLAKEMKTNFVVVIKAIKIESILRAWSMNQLESEITIQMHMK